MAHDARITARAARDVFCALVLAATCAAAADALPFTQSADPIEAYIGDPFEITCRFEGADALPLAGGETRALGISAWDVLENADDAFLESATLAREGRGFSLSLRLVPWKVGEISFKEIDIGAACGAAPAEGAGPVVLKPEAVEVLSVCNRLGARDLRPAVPPHLLPNTNYYIWGAAVSAAFLLTLLFAAALKASSIRGAFRRLARQAARILCARRAKRKVARALKGQSDDRAFAEAWQKIMREYLGAAFGASFASVPASALAAAARYAGKANDETGAAFDALGALFSRTDYIRYAAGSVDEKVPPEEEHRARFSDGERRAVASETFGIIDRFEEGRRKNA